MTLSMRQNRYKTITLFAVLTSGQSTGATYEVNTESDLADMDVGNGICETVAGTCSLRAAISESNSTIDSDVILIPAGTYAITEKGIQEDLNDTGDFDVLTSVSIVGESTETTIIHGNQLDRVFEINSIDPVWISDLTITGGVDNFSGQPLAQRYGSAINIQQQSTLQLERIQIEGNQPQQDSDSGAALLQSGTLMANRININNNPNSAAIWIAGQVTKLSHCLITGHTHDEEVLPVRHLPGQFDLLSINFTNCAITNNHSPNGLMLVNAHVQEVQFINTTISNNSANLNLITNDNNSQMFFHHSTIHHNQIQDSDGGGAAVIMDVHGPADSTTHFKNSIVSHNGEDTMQMFGVAFRSTGGNYFGYMGDTAVTPLPIEPHDSDIIDPTEPEILEPLITPNPYQAYHQPKPDSPVLGLGLIDQCLTHDQIGRPRVPMHCDSGAIQHNTDEIFASGFEPKQKDI